MFSKLCRSRVSVLPSLVVRNGCAKQPFLSTHLNCAGTLQIRNFSNDSFKDALKKVQKDREAAAAAEDKTDKPVSGDDIKDANATSDETKTEDSKSEAPKGVNIGELRYKLFAFARDSKSFIEDNFKEAWGDMTGANKESLLEKKFEQSQSFKRANKGGEDGDNDAEGAAPSESGGPSALVVVPAAKSYWEQMASRLDAPIIREILRGAKIYTKAAAETDIGKQAQKATQNVRDKIEDAREFWETSQNPIVHTLAGVWENMTGDTEEGLTIAEIRKKDPAFVKENWTEEVKTTLAPLVIKAHLEGNTKALKPWLTEGVYSRLATEIRTRKTEGIVFDSNILEIEENTVILRFLEGGGPVILVVYMVQQINCIRNKEGEVIEGGESEIRAKFYSIAFQQVYEEINNEEDNAVLKWKVVDYQLAGDVPYY